MSCAKCGASISYTPDQGVEVICGLCTQRLCAGAMRRQEDKLAMYSGVKCREMREARKWTQELASHKIGVSVTELSYFERGLMLCPVVVAAWMDQQ